MRSGSIALRHAFVNAGTLEDTGRFSLVGTLVNNGHVAPGASPGMLNLAEALTFGSGGCFAVELDGLASHDLMLATGNVALAGTLALRCFGLCSMSVGDEVAILDTTGQLASTFAPVTLSGFASGAFDVIHDHVGGRVRQRVTQDVSAVVPGPNTCALMAGSLTMVGWIARCRGFQAWRGHRLYPTRMPGRGRVAAACIRNWRPPAAGRQAAIRGASSPAWTISSHAKETKEARPDRADGPSGASGASGATARRAEALRDHPTDGRAAAEETRRVHLGAGNRGQLHPRCRRLEQRLG